MKPVFALLVMLAGCSAQAPEAPTPAAAPPVAAPDPHLQADREARRMQIATKECKTRGDLAKQIMRLRQSNAPMQDVMDIVNKGDDGTGAALVIEAYEMPPFQTEKHQERTIAEFENQAFLACVKRVAASL